MYSKTSKNNLKYTSNILLNNIQKLTTYEGLIVIYICIFTFISGAPFLFWAPFWTRFKKLRMRQRTPKVWKQLSWYWLAWYYLYINVIWVKRKANFIQQKTYFVLIKVFTPLLLCYLNASKMSSLLTSKKTKLLHLDLEFYALISKRTSI